MRTTALAATGAHNEVLVDNEYQLSVGDFRRIAGVLQAETGIHLTTVKASLVYSRLVKRLRHLGLPDFASYCELIERDSGREERMLMCTAMTTNVTRFFREPHHFRHMRDVALPGIAARLRQGERIRLWSSACSSGEEPFSMAITLLTAIPNAPGLDVRILATDYNVEKLEVGRNASYPTECLADVPSELRSRWLRSGSDGSVDLAPQLRSLVAFRELNLMGAWPMKGLFQVVFCRNVVIYFDEATRNCLWQRLAAVVEPDGFLYVGHSERITGPASDYFASEGVTIYRRNHVRAA